MNGDARERPEAAEPVSPVPVLEEPEVDTAALRVAGAQGAKWSLVQTIGGMLSRLAFTFALVRLVGPDNFGIIAQATIYTTLVQVVLDQGFGAALVQRRVLEHGDIGTVTWMNLASGLVMTGVTLVVAPHLAEFFHTPEVTTVLRVLAISVMLRSFQLVPKALVRRRMLFRAQTVIELVAVGVGGVAGIVAAVLGADYWSLVVQTLVYDVLLLVGVNVLVWDLRSFRASRRNLRELWGFSAGLLGSRFLVFFGQNFDNTLIGRYESARQLAFYALSYRLLRMPLQMIGGVANTVSLPIFARLQDDPDRMRSWFLRSTSLVSLVSFPLLTLLIVGARRGVPLVFGDRWAPAVTPLMILCGAGAVDVVRMLLSPVGQARGRTDHVFWWSLITFGTLGVAFYIGIEWGIVGVASAYAIVTVGLWPLNMLHFGRATLPMSLREYAASLVPATGASLVLAGVYLAVELGLRNVGVPTGAELAGAAIVGLAAYGATVRVLFPETLQATLSVGRLMFNRG